MYKKILITLSSSIIYCIVSLSSLANAGATSTVEIKLNNIKIQQEFIQCILLSGVDKKEECASLYKDDVEKKVSDLEKELNNFQPKLSKQKELKALLEGCANTLKSFNENPSYATANAGDCTKEKMEAAHTAVKDEIKTEKEKCNNSDDAEACLQKVNESAKNVDQAMNNVMAALSATIAFCSTVPEPNTCAAFAALQILMAILKSGGGAGDGDGDGKGKKTGGGETSETTNGKKPNGIVESQSGTYTCSKEGTTLSCKSKNTGQPAINLTKFYGGAKIAGFKLKGVGDDYKKPLEEIIKKHNGNISSAMKSYGKNGVLGGEGTGHEKKYGVVFCLDKIEGVKIGLNTIAGLLVYEEQSGTGQYIFSISTPHSACES